MTASFIPWITFFSAEQTVANLTEEHLLSTRQVQIVVVTDLERG